MTAEGTDVEVVWTGTDGHNRVDVYSGVDAVRSTMQILPGPIGCVKFFDADNRCVGVALYAAGMRMRKGIMMQMQTQMQKDA